MSAWVRAVPLPLDVGSQSCEMILLISLHFLNDGLQRHGQDSWRGVGVGSGTLGRIPAGREDPQRILEMSCKVTNSSRFARHAPVLVVKIPHFKKPSVSGQLGQLTTTAARNDA
jgi:hypothetical protein